MCVCVCVCAARVAEIILKEGVIDRYCRTYVTGRKIVFRQALIKERPLSLIIGMKIQTLTCDFSSMFTKYNLVWCKALILRYPRKVAIISNCQQVFLYMHN